MPFRAPATDTAPDQLRSLPAPLAARLLCRQFAHQAQEAVGRIGQPGHDGAVARFKVRVALRRLRVTLKAYEPVLDDTVPRRLSRKAQSLARRIGRMRDREVEDALLTSVMASRSAPQREALSRSPLRTLTPGEVTETGAPLDADAVVADLQARWHRLAVPLREALDTWHEVHRIESVRTVSLFGAVAGDALEDSGARIARRMQRIAVAEDRVGLHAARLAIKAARYLLKPLAGSDGESIAMLAALRDAQDLLGEINDAHALLARVTQARDALATEGTPTRVMSAGLDGVTRDLNARIDAAFAALAPWRDPAVLQERIGQLAGIAERWRSAVAAPVEIERKWLLSALPPRVHGLGPALLCQGYLPGEALVERIRSVTHGNGTTEWIRTVKVGRGMTRIEIEEVTTPGLGETLFALTEGKRVEKRRYTVSDGPLLWEIDDFTDRTLVLAEVELPSEETPIDPPSWLAPYIVREVTGESEFTNWKLAR